jgi:hypothetical protein
VWQDNERKSRGFVHERLRCEKLWGDKINKQMVKQAAAAAASQEPKPQERPMTGKLTQRWSVELWREIHKAVDAYATTHKDKLDAKRTALIAEGMRLARSLHESHPGLVDGRKPDSISKAFYSTFRERHGGFQVTRAARALKLEEERAAKRTDDKAIPVPAPIHKEPPRFVAESPNGVGPFSNLPPAKSNYQRTMLYGLSASLEDILEREDDEALAGIVETAMAALKRKHT